MVTRSFEPKFMKIGVLTAALQELTPRDVRDMLSVYGVSGPPAEELVQVAREARQKGWWHLYGTVLTGAYVGLEAAASEIQAPVMTGPACSPR